MDEPAVEEDHVAVARARGFQFVQDGGAHGHYNRLVKLVLFMLSLGGRMSHATKLASATGRLAAALVGTSGVPPSLEDCVVVNRR